MNLKRLIKNNPSLILNIISNIGISFLLEVFRIRTVKEFSPVYRVVADCFVFIYLFIIEVVFSDFIDINYKLIFIIISYIVIAFSLLIYIEVIIVHAFKLDVNTEVEIKKRSMDDINNIQEFKDEIISTKM